MEAARKLVEDGVYLVKAKKKNPKLDLAAQVADLDSKIAAHPHRRQIEDAVSLALEPEKPADAPPKKKEEASWMGRTSRKKGLGKRRRPPPAKARKRSKNKWTLPKM